MRRLLTFFLFLATATVLPTAAHAFSKELGDSAYREKNYMLAAEIYGRLTKTAPSADLFYNLGNANYRLKQHGQAVLAYERALRLDPKHEDARFNLELLRNRRPDHFAAPPGVFLWSWVQRLVASKSIDDWVWLSFAFLLFAALFAVLYRASKRMAWRKTGFFGAFLAFCLFLLTTLFAFFRLDAFENDRRAVIVVPKVKTYVSPTEGSRADVVLHEGTTVEIVERSGRFWLCAVLPDGKKVWLKKGSIERIVANL